MPTNKHRIIERTLLSKFRFSREETDHSIFIFLYNGKRVLETKISHQSRNTDIPKGLVGKIARDLQLSGRKFQEAIQCSLSRDDYIRLLSEKGLL